MAKQKTEAIEKVQPAAMAMPDFLKEEKSKAGLENITNDDVKMPRLALAQQMSPELQEMDPKYVDGLKVGDFFNTLLKEVYGKGPLTFVVIRNDKPRGVEFFPRAEGGGVKDFNVPLTDPRMQFTDGPDGKRVKPVATKFYDYVLYLPEFDHLVAMSLKGSALGTAKNLNAMIVMRNKPCYAGLYTVLSTMQKNAKGTFAVPVVDNAGWVQTKSDYDRFVALHEQFKGKELKIDREPGEDDEDFPTDGSSPQL